MKLPKGWKQFEIGTVALINERSISSDTSPNFKFRYLELSSVDRGRINLPTDYLTLKSAPSRARRLLQSNDVLMSMVRPNLQGFARFEEAPPDLVVSTGFAVISPTQIDSRYLYQSLYGPQITSQLTRLLAGSGYPSLNSSDIEELLVAAPTDRAEQEKIAAILTAWDDVIEKLDALIDAKERHKKALMQQLLVGEKRNKRFKGSIWRQIHIGDVLERVYRPVSFGANAPLALVSIRRRFGGLFRRPDVLASEYKTQDLHELKTGDFLISKRQVVHGAWSIVEPEFNGTLVSKEYVILENHAPDKLNIRFFAWLAQTPRMLRLARVASTGIHIEKLIFDPDVFLREQIRIPSDVKEQKFVADVLDAVEIDLKLLHQQRDALDRQKRGLMQKLLTGAIRVKP